MKARPLTALASVTSIACLVLVVNLLAEACLVDSICFNNADCSPDRACVLLQGASRARCVSRCEQDADCPAGNICASASGVCQPAECQNDEDCAGGFECHNGRCGSAPVPDPPVPDPPVPDAALPDAALPDAALPDTGTADADGGRDAARAMVFRCPDGMAPIEQAFCVDIYEASRPDATEDSPGVDESVALSRKGVMPWAVADNATAQQACEAASKTLCTARQWETACRGPAGTAYAYGDDYDPVICNGIDKYCECPEDSLCAGQDPCPFPHCYRQCGGSYSFTPFRLDPTGANPGCTNGYGIFDINGNIWEHVFKGDERSIRGGAYNCADSERLHRCDYIPGTWEPDARGFRCCSAGRLVPAEETDQQSDGGPGP